MSESLTTARSERSEGAEAFEALQRVELLLVRLGRYDEAAAVATARCDYRDALERGWALSEPVGTDANCPPVFGTGTRLAAGPGSLSGTADPESNAAEAPCTRCGATPETGQTDGCPECDGVVSPVPVSPETPEGARSAENAETRGGEQR